MLNTMVCYKIFFMDKLNNNKRDINSYVNGNDLSRYLHFMKVTPDEKIVYRESELVGSGGFVQFFNGFSDTLVILLGDQNPSGVGHFVVLRRDSVEMNLYTYFDCLGGKIPDSIRSLFPQDRDAHVKHLTEPLMSRKENLCGKYCVSFCMAGNIDVAHYADILRSGKGYSPDEFINNLIRINYTDNVIENFLKQ
jgi:hypothetical protein